MLGVMIQGTASDVGKSLLSTALCRLFVNAGYRVAPFKSQNMSSNIQFIDENKQISKAQALQIEAAKVEPLVWMNPIVLKPHSEMMAEVIMLGKSVGLASGKEYHENFYEKGLQVIEQSLEKLHDQFDIVIMEGAGSPVEINLKNKELVNMKVAEMADVPVLLVADIDRGGVFASIVGTMELLSSAERERVQGIFINKFRGDLSLFSDGVKWIEVRLGIPVLGVIPYVEHHIEAEDSLSDQNGRTEVISPNFQGDRFEQLASQVEKHIDIEQIKKIMMRWRKR